MQQLIEDQVHLQYTVQKAYSGLAEVSRVQRCYLPWPLQDPVNTLADGMCIKGLAGDVLDSFPHGCLCLNEPLLHIASCSFGVEGGLQAQLLALLTQHCCHLCHHTASVGNSQQYGNDHAS